MRDENFCVKKRRRKVKKIFNNVLDLVGNTPLVKLSAIAGNLEAEIAGKLEYFNPCGSVKDRIGRSMIEAAEKKGILKKGAAIVEPTSGNTGIGLAFVAAVKGYKLILTMPDTMSVERRNLIKAFGAEVILTPGAKGMKGAIAKAEDIVKKNKGSVILQQFTNPANPEAHRKKTALEIWNDTGGKVDILVAGVGTGGTITGVAEVLKKKKPGFKAIAVEPDDSAVLSGGTPGPHKIQGIGAGFVPEVLNRKIIDEVVRVTSADAFKTARELAKKEGIFAGISSGAAVFAAIQIAKRKENRGKRIVVILPDSGDRYLSTELFNVQ